MRSNLRVVLTGLILAAIALPGFSQLERPVYLDRDGEPLPIQDDREILDFLAHARETGAQPLSSGITKASRLELTQGDLTIRAVFHHIDRKEPKQKRLPNGKMVAYMRDSYTSQVAAYRLARLLGIPNIPPTVLRRSNHRRGSTQLWIEKAMRETDRLEQGIEPPAQNLWNQLYADMRVFDNLINNIDRNTGNMLFDSNGYLWLIDHTRSFGKDRGLPRPETVTRCSRRLYKAIQDLDRGEVERVMRPQASAKRDALLAPDEIAALFSRREKLLELFARRIENQGTIEFLFDYGDPDPGIIVTEDAG